MRGRSRVTRAAREAVLRTSSTPPFDLFVRAVDRLGRWPHGTLAVLTYHRIAEPGDDAGFAPSVLSATPAAFDAQLAVLRTAMQPIDAARFLEALEQPRRLPARAVLVTVDDAYADFEHTAWPILRRHDVPVVLFVPTAFPGDPAARFWWDRVHAALRRAADASVTELSVAGLGTLDLVPGPAPAFEVVARQLKALPHAELGPAVDRLVAAAEAALDGRTVAGHVSSPDGANPMLDWDALRRLASDGVALAPHGRTHAFLDRLPPAELRDEVEGSRRDLERETGSALPLFAYPAGQHDAASVRAVADAGLAAAFTTQRGANRLGRVDPLLLRRVNVGVRSSPALVRAQLTPLAVRLGTARDRRAAPMRESRRIPT